MATDVETVTRVLAEHGPDFARVNHCQCGAVIHDESQFRSHVAAEVVAALNLPGVRARAWDEGHIARDQDNPHRAKQ